MGQYSVMKYKYLYTHFPLQAGRLKSMDALAAEFVAAAGGARDALVKKALAAGDDAKHYVRVMQKVVGGSEEYIEKEVKRYMSIN